MSSDVGLVGSVVVVSEVPDVSVVCLVSVVGDTSGTTTTKAALSSEFSDRPESWAIGPDLVAMCAGTSFLSYRPKGQVVHCSHEGKSDGNLPSQVGHWHLGDSLNRQVNGAPG